MRKILTRIITILSMLIIFLSLFTISKTVSGDISIILLQNSTKLDKKDEIKQRFDELKQENSDFIGWIKFESGLVNLPVVQTDSDYYINHDFNKKFSTSGAIYVNPDQEIGSKLVALYGHYHYFKNIMFTPLDRLRSEKYYNSTSEVVYLIKREEKISYRVAAVVEYDLEQDSEHVFNYELPYYTESQLKEVLAYAESHKLYETGISLDTGSNYLFLQTCIKNKENVRNVVILKES